MSSEPTPLSAEGYTVESYVREEMDERDWSLKDLARHSGLSVERLGQFLHLGMWGDDIAPALEMAFGVDAQTWANLWLADVGRELNRQAQATEIAALKRTAAFAEAVGLSAFEIFTDYKAENAALRGALEDIQAVQAEYDSSKAGLIPVAGWRAIRERLQHADVARVLAGKEAQGEAH